MLSPNSSTLQQTRTMPATKRPSRRSASAHLSRISQRNVSRQDAQQVLTAAFTADDYPACIKDLNGRNIDPQAYIDGLDQVSSCPSMFTSSTLTGVPHQITDILPTGSEIYNRCLRALRKTCGIYGLLPSSHHMPQGLTLVTSGEFKRPFASGGFSDVWRARNENGQLFAIKHIRTYEVDNQEHMRKVLQVCHLARRCFSLESLHQGYCKEVTICKRIRHENVLSVEGVAPELFEFCMVSRWMENGNMLNYVRTQEGVDRARLVSSSASWWCIDLSSSPMFSCSASRVASTISTPMR